MPTESIAKQLQALVEKDDGASVALTMSSAQKQTTFLERITNINRIKEKPLKMLFQLTSLALLFNDRLSLEKVVNAICRKFKARHLNSEVQFLAPH